MKKKLVQFLLLFSLFFNIAHATVIAFEDDCHHETEYVLDTHLDDDCGDMCDTHHLFHFMAIINTPHINLNTTKHTEKLTLKATRHSPAFKKTSIKPPIA